MTSRFVKIAAVALAAAMPLAACDKAADTAATPETAKAEGSDKQTLLAAVGGGGYDTLKQGIEGAQLTSLFEGPASYTLLAPKDEAFAALGEQGNALLQPDQRALLVAVLRSHLIPGHLDSAAIAKAIADKKGPVTMKTLGDGTVTFAKDGDAITVTGSDGSKAKLAGESSQASNGVLIPIDAVLMPKEPAAAQ